MQHRVSGVLQIVQQELDRLAQNKRVGLDQLKQLTSQQQDFDAQLSQAHQECDASGRQLERLQRENRSVQVRSGSICCMPMIVPETICNSVKANASARQGTPAST